VYTYYIFFRDVFLALTRVHRSFISDIGATGLQPLFIAGSCVTVVFLDLSFLAERWLRHSGQLARNKGRFDKICSVVSIIFSIAGAAGLILLSCFNDRDYDRLHDAFLGLFM
jgi:Frag1/DRAM/Sfk1 family